MVLFMIGAFPAFIACIVLSSEFGRRLFMEYRRDFLFGFIACLASMFVYYLFRGLFVSAYSFWGIVFSSFFGDYFFTFVLAAVLYLIFYRKEETLPRDTFERVSAYIAGFYILSGLFDFIVSFGNFNFYNLFMLPLTRITAFIAIPMLVERAADEAGVIKALLLLACAAFFFVFALLFYLYLSNVLIVFYILSFAIFFSSCYLLYRRI